MSLLTEFGLRVDLKLPNAPYERLALRRDTEILLQEPPNGLLLLNARGCQFHGFVVWYFPVRLHQYFRLFLVPQELYQAAAKVSGRLAQSLV